MPNFLRKLKSGHILFLLLFATTINSYAQKSKGEYIFLGDKAFNSGDYKTAGINFQKALVLDTSNLNIAFKYAQTQQYLRNYYEAVHQYRRIIALDNENKFIQSYFFLALAEKNLSQYSNAERHLRKLKELSQTFSIPVEIRNQIDNEIISVQYALNNHSKKNRVFLQHLPAPINSPYSDFNPVMVNTTNTLYFSVYKPVFDNDTNETMFSQSFTTEIMVSKDSKNGWQNPESVGSKVNNNRYHNANVCFNALRTKAYFSRCFDSDNAVGNCAIYSADIKNGEWKNIKKLNSNINAPNSSNTQPYYLETDQFKILYFVSNRINGYGGYDIWFSLLQNGDFKEATNLGSNINTSGNELSPAYQAEKGEFYFSSDKLPGFGGYDIFKCKGVLNDLNSPQNMELPINSALNDLYYTPVPYTNEAYFASNRPGSFHLENAEYCCNDIYYVDIANDSIPSPLVLQPPIVKKDSVQQKIQELLPLTLYFHNDEPDPKTMNTGTDKNYKNLLAAYISQKQIYAEEYSKNLEPDKAVLAAKEIEDFFKDSIEGGFVKLEMFADLLKTEISKGKHVKIKIKGYASPLNTKAYNLNLSKRRIASLVNFLNEYQNGYFLPYLNGNSENGGKIIIYEDAFGDTKASEFVSNNPNDIRNSVYSKSAALERKIQIVMYSSDEEKQEENTDFEYPEMNWGKSNFSLDTLSRKENKTFILYLKNTGKSELDIKNVQTNSENVQLMLEKTKLQPEEEISLYGMIKTADLIEGEHLEKIEFLTNMVEAKQVIYLKFWVK